MNGFTEYGNVVNMICIIFGFLLESLATRDFFDFFLKRRYRSVYYYAYMILLTVLFYFVRVVLGLQMEGLLICYMCSAIFVYYMYEGSNKRKAGAVLLLCVICALFDSLEMEMVKHLICEETHYMAYFAYIILFTKLELFLVIDILGNFIGEEKNALFNKPQRLLVNLLPIGIIITAAIDYCRLMFVGTVSVWTQFGMVALSMIGLMQALKKNIYFSIIKGRNRCCKWRRRL